MDSIISCTHFLIFVSYVELFSETNSLKDTVEIVGLPGGSVVHALDPWAGETPQSN